MTSPSQRSPPRARVRRAAARAPSSTTRRRRGTLRAAASRAGRGSSPGREPCGTCGARPRCSGGVGSGDADARAPP